MDPLSIFGIFAAGAIVGVIAGIIICCLANAKIDLKTADRGFMVVDNKLFKVTPAEAVPVNGNASGGPAVDDPVGGTTVARNPLVIGGG